MPIRILLADDHEVVLEGIRTLVTKAGRGWEICGEAHNGKEAVEMTRTLQPDIVILDITMPVMNGLEAAKQITEGHSTCRALMFTMHDSRRLGIEAREAGAQGYVVKSQAARDLIRAIDNVLVGKTFFGTPPESEKAENNTRKNNSSILFCRALGFA
jgi:DNA-binding NarL/FixJ family response regulator